MRIESKYGLVGPSEAQQRCQATKLKVLVTYHYMKNQLGPEYKYLYIQVTSKAGVHLTVQEGPRNPMTVQSSTPQVPHIKTILKRGRTTISDQKMPYMPQQSIKKVLASMHENLTVHYSKRSCPIITDSIAILGIYVQYAPITISGAYLVSHPEN